MITHPIGWAASSRILILIPGPANGPCKTVFSIIPKVSRCLNRKQKPRKEQQLLSSHLLPTNEIDEHGLPDDLNLISERPCLLISSALLDSSGNVVGIRQTGSCTPRNTWLLLRHCLASWGRGMDVSTFVGTSYSVHITSADVSYGL